MLDYYVAFGIAFFLVVLIVCGVWHDIKKARERDRQDKENDLLPWPKWDECDDGKPFISPEMASEKKLGDANEHSDDDNPHLGVGNEDLGDGADPDDDGDDLNCITIIIQIIY